MRVIDLPTPALLLDKDVLESNARVMLERADKLGVVLRPNIKTHKCAEIGEMQLCGTLPKPGTTLGKRGEMRVVTSTLSETRFFLENGFGDVLYAVVLAGRPKIVVAQELLLQYGRRVSFMVDSVEGVFALPVLSQPWPVFCKVDGGYGRAGRNGEALHLVMEAAQQDKRRCELRGVYTHAGHSYHIDHKTESLEHQAAVEARSMLLLEKQEGLIVSVGATPTASHPAKREEYRYSLHV
jgi:D-serine deaminase-like pyridoxal phosphate-dependent protein